MTQETLALDQGEKKRRLEILAAEIRITALKGFAAVGSGHVGGTMSLCELMAVLYGGTMRIDPQNPAWEDRDWLVVSKGHCGPAVYAALARRGYFPEDEITTLNKPGTRLPSHCDRRKTPGIDMTTGSLGQGMSTAIGVAWGHQYLGKPNYTYLVLGDGESQEGQVWEGALFAAQHKLSRLIAFADCNQKQLDGYTKDICDLGDYGQKFRDFGWYVIECDGHDVLALESAVALAKQNGKKPSMIVMHTEKGRGCPFTEGVFYNHYVPAPADACKSAIEKLEGEIQRLRERKELSNDQ
jgi:transketolase